MLHKPLGWARVWVIKPRLLNTILSLLIREGVRAAAVTWNDYPEREHGGQDVEITAPKRLVHQIDSDEEFAHERLNTRVNELAAPQVSFGVVRVQIVAGTGDGSSQAIKCVFFCFCACVRA